MCDSHASPVLYPCKYCSPFSFPLIGMRCSGLTVWSAAPYENTGPSKNRKPSVHASHAMYALVSNSAASKANTRACMPRQRELEKATGAKYVSGPGEEARLLPLSCPETGPAGLPVTLRRPRRPPLAPAGHTLAALSARWERVSGRPSPAHPAHRQQHMGRTWVGGWVGACNWVGAR